MQSHVCMDVDVHICRSFMYRLIKSLRQFSNPHCHVPVKSAWFRGGGCCCCCCCCCWLGGWVVTLHATHPCLCYFSAILQWHGSDHHPKLLVLWGYMTGVSFQFPSKLKVLRRFFHKIHQNKPNILQKIPRNFQPMADPMACLLLGPVTKVKE